MNVKEETIELYDLNEQTSKSDFEARVFSRLGHNVSNMKITRANGYTTNVETVLNRNDCKNLIFAAIPNDGGLDQEAARKVKSKRFWHDVKKGVSIEDSEAVVECDLFLKFGKGSLFEHFTAKSPFGHVADKVFTLTKGNAIDLASIDLSGGSVRCEITSEPGCLRHKLYQLHRATLCIPDPHVKLHVIAINGILKDAIKFIEVAQRGMQNLPEEYHQIPCVVIWTKTRNVFSAIKSIETQVEGLTQRVEGLEERVEGLAKHVEGLAKHIDRGFFLLVALGVAMVVLSSQIIATQNELNDRLDTLLIIVNQKNAVVDSHGAGLPVLGRPGVDAFAVPAALGVAMVVLSSQNIATRNELNDLYDMPFNIVNQKDENTVVGSHGAGLPVLGGPGVDSCAVQARGVEEGGRYHTLMGIYGVATGYGQKQHQQF